MVPENVSCKQHQRSIKKLCGKNHLHCLRIICVENMANRLIFYSFGNVQSKQLCMRLEKNVKSPLEIQQEREFVCVCFR